MKRTGPSAVMILLARLKKNIKKKIKKKHEKRDGHAEGAAATADGVEQQSAAWSGSPTSPGRNTKTKERTYMYITVPQKV